MANIGKDIGAASAMLKEGKLVAIPTETVYGLAADYSNEQAVSRIFEVKNRPSFDPLIVHLGTEQSPSVICKEIPDSFYKLYEAFCPGPITFILQKKESVPSIVTAGHNSVGMRFPNHPLTQELLNSSGLMLAAPSANPFGYVSPTSAQHVNTQLGDSIDYILDGGPCTVGLESTIIDLSTKAIKILRMGGLELERIESVLGQSIARVKTSSSNPKAPGMLSSHYAPRKKLVFGDMEENYRIFKGSKLASITFRKKISCIPEKNQWILSPGGDLREAAAALFKALREIDETDIEVILAERFPEEGLGRAINDRLLRAGSR